MTKEHKNQDNESDVHINSYFTLHGQPRSQHLLYLKHGKRRLSMQEGKCWSWKHYLALSLSPCTQREHCTVRTFYAPRKNTWQHQRMNYRKAITRTVLNWPKESFPYGGVLDVYIIQTSSIEGFSNLNPRDTLLHFP